VRCAIVAFNRGRQAGASRSHEHGQLFGLELVPPTVAREAESFASRPCVLCALRADAEVVAVHSGVAVVAHPVPLVAHELLVVPPCTPRFDGSDDATLDQTGAAVADALSRARAALGGGLSTNLVVHTAPESCERFHWHAHLYPRTSVWGALEVGAELPIVAADPASTASLFRAAVSGP
jgi:galactose-1-phosphate uridylyltransferase